MSREVVVFLTYFAFLSFAFILFLFFLDSFRWENRLSNLNCLTKSYTYLFRLLLGKFAEADAIKTDTNAGRFLFEKTK